MRPKTTIILLFSAFLLLAVIFLLVAPTLELQKKPILEDATQNEIYNLYIAKKPVIEGRPFYGDATAPITLVLYTDFSSEGAKTFANTTLVSLKDEFIHTGKARLYYKYYLTAEDLRQKGETYYYAQSLACYYHLAPESFYDFYFELFTIDFQDLLDLAVEKGVNRTEFLSCIEEEDFRELRMDASERDAFSILFAPKLYVGIEGDDNSVVSGNPDYERVRLLVREYETRVGE